MATSVSKCFIFFSFLWLLLLLSSIDGREISRPGNICEFPSGLFKGICFSKDSCNKLCREREGAVRGYCPFGVCTCNYVCTGFCESLSGAYHGICIHNPDCAKLCREQENKFSGYCDTQLKCWCSYYC